MFGAVAVICVRRAGGAPPAPSGRSLAALVQVSALMACPDVRGDPGAARRGAVLIGIMRDLRRLQRFDGRYTAVENINLGKVT